MAAKLIEGAKGTACRATREQAKIRLDLGLFKKVSHLAV